MAFDALLSCTVSQNAAKYGIRLRVTDFLNTFVSVSCRWRCQDVTRHALDRNKMDVVFYYTAMLVNISTNISAILAVIAIKPLPKGLIHTLPPDPLPHGEGLGPGGLAI